MRRYSHFPSPLDSNNNKIEDKEPLANPNDVFDIGDGLDDQILDCLQFGRNGGQLL